MNFTTQVFQSIGLGYGEPSKGLIKRRPRKPEEPLLTHADTRWFIVAGLVMGVATLAVIAGAEHDEGEQLARTMGMTTFGLANLVFSFTARDALRSVFNLETFGDRRFLTTSLMSAAAIVFATELGFFQRILDTVAADRRSVADLHRRGLEHHRRSRRHGSSCCAARPRPRVAT